MNESSSSGNSFSFIHGNMILSSQLSTKTYRLDVVLLMKRLLRFVSAFGNLVPFGVEPPTLVLKDIPKLKVEENILERIVEQSARSSCKLSKKKSYIFHMLLYVVLSTISFSRFKYFLLH